MPYYNVPDAVMAASVDIDIDKLPSVFNKKE